VKVAIIAAVTAVITALAVSAVVPFLSVPTLVTIALVTGSVVILGRYRSRSPVLSGALPLVIVAMVVLYVAGSLPRVDPVFGVNPGHEQWLIYLLGFLCLVGGLALGGLVIRTPAPVLSVPERPRSWPPNGTAEWLLYIGVGVAIVVATLNYLTGDIPALTGDVNEARFSGNFGVLGRLWPIVFPTLQATIVIAASRVLSGRWDPIWLLLAAASLVILVLSGGRSLFLLPLIAVGVLFLDLKRPALGWILTAGVLGAAAFAAIGELRVAAEDLSATEFRDDRGLTGWLGSLDISLQTGPRVMASALEQLNGQLLGGSVLFGDLLNFLSSSFTRSDRIITELLGRDVDEVGGFPPTIWGGLVLDFGIIGVATGGLIVGLVLGASRMHFFRTRSLGSGIWYSYFASYVALSAYSYISFRPSWILVLIVALVASKGFAGGTHEDPNGLEVPGISGRS